MSDIFSASYATKWGVPVAEPSTDYSVVRSTLSQMTLAYPGQFFTIEDISGEQGQGAVVTWIPPWTVQHLVMNAFSTALLPGSDNGWPNIR